MKLFWIYPAEPEKFFYLFIVEVILIFMCYPVLYGMGMMTVKLRMHVHIRIFMIFVYINCSLFYAVRLVVLACQCRWIEINPVPEENTIIIICSFVRVHYLAVLCTIGFPLALEREFSLLFIRDYEKNCRLWIPGLLIIWSIGSNGFASYLVTYGIYPLFQVTYVLAGIATAGLLIYLYNFRKAWILNKKLKNRLPCRVSYSLSVRYQLEENLWFAEMIKSLTATLGVVTTITITMFLVFNLRWIPQEAKDYLDCVFNIWLAASCPVILIGTFIYNRYLIGFVKGMFFGSTVEPEVDEGDFYFDQLLHQWNEPLVAEKKQKKKTILMKILFLEDD